MNMKTLKAKGAELWNVRQEIKALQEMEKKLKEEIGEYLEANKEIMVNTDDGGIRKMLLAENTTPVLAENKVIFKALGENVFLSVATVSIEKLRKATDEKMFNKMVVDTKTVTQIKFK